MNDPRRWRDDPTAHEMRELLRHARPPRGIDPETLRRSRLRVAGLAALPLSVGLLTWLPSLALGAVAGAVVGAATLGALGSAPPAADESASAQHAIAPQRTPSARTEQARVSEIPAPSVVTTPMPGASTTAPGKRAAPLAPSGHAPAAENDLVKEVALLDRARAQLPSAPQVALRILDQHRRDYAHGTLTLEREFLAVEALVRSGRRAEAQQRGHALRSRAPGSLYEQRLDALLSSSKAP
ncbi:MAG TPA: hypothetical protein VER33_20000 [Polyangiaceae bacterium]|nr:hypothetical protein [Polyangiaceae bacterium]